MKFLSGLFFIVFLSQLSVAQSIEETLEQFANEKEALQGQMNNLDTKIIDWKQRQIISKLKDIGLPSHNHIEHHAMILEYSETHEQAKWVAHMIIPDIKDGLVYRSNDFRVDPKVTTGTAVQEDYFLTDTLANGDVDYDGFGYDRGHLAPSADFRWSAEALSESYYYSNMSPQLPEFNREKWAELENQLRRYVISNEVPLYIITVPIFDKESTKLERSINGLTIPARYAKAAYDPINKIAIGFLMDNKKLEYPLESYAVPIEQVEKIAGLEIFTSISPIVKSSITKELWFDHLKDGDKEPINVMSLPNKCYNTVQAAKKIGKNIYVCGTVVASRYSKKKHLWLNLDRQFPNQIFSVFIKKEDLVNFDYDVKERFTNQSVCVKGTVEEFSSTPSITLHNEKDIVLFVQDSENNQ